MPVTIDVNDRDRILRYAGDLVPREDRGNPVKVSAAAVPLLEWAEQAADDDDLRARMKAFSLQYQGNRDAFRETSPATFVDDAGVRYAFLTAGQEGR